MRIGYVTTYDPRDRSQWSGLGYYVAHALRQQHHCVHGIGPLRKVRPWLIGTKKAFYAARRQRYLADRDTEVVKAFGAQASQRLAHLQTEHPLDVLVSPGTIPVAYLESERPIVVWSDSCFAAMLDFYPDFTGLCEATRRAGDAIEAAALERAAFVIYSSEWAARTARQCYGVPAEKLAVVPFGANMERTPSLDEVRCLIERRTRARELKLVFLGVDWQRKGGDVALAVARTLNQQGIPTRLFIAGSRPPLRGKRPPWLVDVGSIGKNSPSRQAALEGLLNDAHFLILPTRADCTPVSFSEANAFGVPALASRVGGVPSIIRSGESGEVFDLGDVDGYCAFISSTFCRPERYRDLALGAYHEYVTRLNWPVAAGAVSRLLQQVGER
jgi:glycosyltransferase involved in cell wall biosynthesis